MHRSYLILVLAVLTLSAACSKAPVESAKTNSTSNGTLNDTNPANQNSQVVIPGIQGAPANAEAQPGGKFDVPQKSGTNPAPAGAPVAPSERPAPDGSTFSSRLTDVAVETRTFQKHPQLLKVVKTIAPGKTTIKVFLRSGKVVDLPGERITNLSVIPAAEILSLVGIKPPPPVSLPDKVAGTEKQ